jgi:hypothetical protein
MATIQPEKHSHLWDRDKDLSEGRIIARMFLSKGEARPYNKLGLVKGQTTYWWVQKIPGQPDSAAGRSVYITISGDTLVKKEFTLRYEGYRAGTAKQALARWLWQPKDETTQGSCGSGTCR